MHRYNNTIYDDLSPEIARELKKFQNKEYYQEVVLRAGNIQIDMEKGVCKTEWPRELLFGDISLPEVLGIPDPATPAIILEEKEEKIRIMNAISRLSKIERFVIIGIFYEQVRQVDLARQLNTSPQYITNVKRKALRKLKDLLS